MSAAASNRGLVALFKKGMSDYPDIMLSSVMGLIGIGVASYSVYKYYEKDGDNRRYKEVYTVYRHDDPRVARIRKD